MADALRIAGAGLTAELRRAAVAAHNVANVQTPAFQEQRLEAKDGPSASGAEGAASGVRAQAGVRMAVSGGFVETGQPLDLAIAGDGFFQVRRPDGRLAYTRAGAFARNGEGTVVTAEGIPLEPPIVVPAEATGFSIARDGVASFHLPNQAGPQVGGRVELARFRNPDGLEALGAGLFAASAASGDPIVGMPGRDGLGEILQGMRETSNVDLVRAQVDLIVARQAAGAQAAVVRTADDLLHATVDLKR